MVAHLEKMKMRLLGILSVKVLMKMAIVFPRCVILHMFGFAKLSSSFFFLIFFFLLLIFFLS
jgi:hypothetical protein